MSTANQMQHPTSSATDRAYMLGTAQKYGRADWRVFPVWPIKNGRCSCGKVDCKSPGKHPIERLTGDWRSGATTNEDAIRQWWSQVPDANIATPNFLRIDVDARDGGLENWEDLIAHNGLPDTPHVFTPSGGLHFYFEPPLGWNHSNKTGNLPKGIDVRGHGTGYTLLPPSNHVSGFYECEVSSHPCMINVAPLPEWLVDLLAPTQSVVETVLPVSFSKNGSGRVDLTKFDLPELIRVTIQRVPDRSTDRSAIDQSVIAALIRAGTTDDDVKSIFDQYSIGREGKYAEKGSNGPAYLAHSIGNARKFAFGRQGIVKSEHRDDQVLPVSITEQLPQVELKLLEKSLQREELGDGELFAQLYDRRIVYDHAESANCAWHFWDGHFWRRDKTSLIKPLFSNQLSAQYVMGAITASKLAIAAREGNEPGKADKLSELNNSMSKRAHLLRRKTRSSNVLDYAASLMGISGSEWDSKPLLLPTRNGVVNLESGELSPGNPRDYLRTASPAKWRSIDEPCSRFERFLLEIMGGNAEMVSFLQRLLGYGISGLTAEHVFPIFWGESGRNGKDTLLETLGYVMGPLAGAVSKDAILDAGSRRSGGAAEPHIYDLRGKRLVWASEPHEGARLDTAQVKLVTGGGRLKARPLYGNYVEWTPTHLVILVTNPRPHAAADDQALWSRIQLIPFTQRFVDKPEGQNEHLADKRLKAKLRKEASGILAWLVRGFLAWQKDGLNPPDLVTKVTAEYQHEEDTLGQFIDECCLVADHVEAGASQLVIAYREWCEGYGIRNPMDGRTFGMKLAQRFAKKHTRNGNVYFGIGLLA